MRCITRLLGAGLAGQRAQRVAVGILSLAFLPILAVGSWADLSTPVFYNAGPIPESLAAGDLDDDGDHDLAVINRQGHLRLLFNDGAGCFRRVARHDRLWSLTSSGVWPFVPSLVDLALGDLNGDGRGDFAATWGEGDGIVSVASNQGDGTPGIPATFGGCAHVKNIAIADLNGDGRNDLAVTSNCFKATVLLNDGRGGFTVAGSFGSGYTSTEIAIDDLDGDGDGDIAFLNVGISNVALLANNGDGTFESMGGYAVGDNPWDLVLADFDADGDSDLATANFYSNDVSVLLNDGRGQFALRTEIGTGSEPEGLAAGDLDGDGRPELVTANGGSDDLAILSNAGGGAFFLQQRLAAGDRPNDVALVDLDRNGRIDIVGLNRLSESVGVILNGGAACPAPAPEPPNGIFMPIFTKAVLDGARRLVVINWGTDARSADVAIFRNGHRLLTTVNDSYHWDEVPRKRGRTFTYQVCETGAFASCTAESTVSF